MNVQTVRKAAMIFNIIGIITCGIAAATYKIGSFGFWFHFSLTILNVCLFLYNIKQFRKERQQKNGLTERTVSRLSGGYQPDTDPDNIWPRDIRPPKTSSGVPNKPKRKSKRKSKKNIDVKKKTELVIKKIKRVNSIIGDLDGQQKNKTRVNNIHRTDVLGKNDNPDKSSKKTKNS